jgi:hypothetical protein
MMITAPKGLLTLQDAPESKHLIHAGMIVHSPGTLASSYDYAPQLITM